MLQTLRWNSARRCALGREKGGEKSGQQEKWGCRSGPVTALLISIGSSRLP